jgi:hypothetical protein
MPLVEAEQVLGQASGAWRHADCPAPAGVRRSTHIFYYGSRLERLTGVVIIKGDGPANNQVVTEITSLENDALGVYDHCPEVDLLRKAPS